MSIYQIIILICWGVFLFYWLVNWRNVKPTKERKFSANNSRVIIISIIVIALIAQFFLHNFIHIPSCQWSWAGCHFSPKYSQSLLLGIVGDMLAILGVSIAIIARKTLAGNWSAGLDLKKGHELVTTGIYHYIRHPIYTGVLLIFVGAVLEFQSRLELIAFLAVTIMFLYRIKREEELMTKTFPKEYPEYKKRTKALIPFVW